MLADGNCPLATIGIAQHDRAMTKKLPSSFGGKAAAAGAAIGSAAIAAALLYANKRRERKVANTKTPRDEPPQTD